MALWDATSARGELAGRYLFRLAAKGCGEQRTAQALLLGVRTGATATAQQGCCYSRLTRCLRGRAFNLLSPRHALRTERTGRI